MVSVVTLPPAVLPILSSLTRTSLSNHCGCVCVRSLTVVAPSVLPESTLNLCCVFLCIYAFIKSVWWSTIACRIRLCACVFLIIKVILWFGGCFQTVCFCLFVCVHGFFITSSRKLSQPSLRAHPGCRSFPTSHHAHPHSAQFTLLLPLDLDGLMLGWGNASKGSAFLTSDPDVSFICRSALRGCGVCVSWVVTAGFEVFASFLVGFSLLCCAPGAACL